MTTVDPSGDASAGAGVPIRHRRAAHAFVVASVAAIAIGIVLSTNTMGHVVEGALIALVGSALYYVGLKRHGRRELLSGVLTFAALAAAALLTLTIHWESPTANVVGRCVQVLAGLLAIARMVREFAPRPSTPQGNGPPSTET